MNIVSRSFAAQNAIIPPSANSVNGKTSVCIVGARPGVPYERVLRRVGVPARAAAAPTAARAAAEATNAPPGSTERSAISSTLPSPSASSVPHRNSVGRSTASASASVVMPAGPLPAYRPRASPATPSATTDSATCAGQRWCRGRNASTSTATHAAPSTISSGAIAA